MSCEPPKKKLKQLKITGFVLQGEKVVANCSTEMDKSQPAYPKCSFSKADDKVIIEMPPDFDNSIDNQTCDGEKPAIIPMVQDSKICNDVEDTSIQKVEPITGPISSSLQRPTNSKKPIISFKGYPLDGFAQLSHNNLCIPKLEIAENHTVFVKLPIPERGIPEPDSPSEDLWDDKHVKMPHSPHSLYHNIAQNGKLIERWAVICEALSTEISSVQQLKEAIFSYNHRYREKWSFCGIRNLLEKEFCEEEHNFFFESVLPGIIRLAIGLPSTISKPIPLLIRGKSQSLSLSQKQVASLLANAFLCTFPRRNVKGFHSEYASFPDINFSRLFNHQDKKAYEKLKCIIHYFKEITTKEPDGMITFTRQSISCEDLPNFECSSTTLPKFHIDSKGLIEEADGFLHVDFANKYIGGGVLGLGCVQEEIRFVMYPELLVTRLFTEVLTSHEALTVIGAERYNNISGYASTFNWEGPHYDVTPRDPGQRRLSQLVCIDATNFSRKQVSQYQKYYIMRELKKAYIGYSSLSGSEGTPSAVATGNWGCGAFRGNPILKGLIQLSAAAEAYRDVDYFTFGDQKLRDDLYDIYQFLESSGVTVGELIRLLCQYGQRENVSGDGIAEYIKNSIFSAYNSDTDSDAT